VWNETKSFAFCWHRDGVSAKREHDRRTVSVHSLRRSESFPEAARVVGIAADGQQEVAQLKQSLESKEQQINQLVKEGNPSHAARVRSMEAEASRLQASLEKRDQQIAQLQAAAASAAEAGDAEKQALLQRAAESQAKSAQLAKTFDDEKAALRRRLTEQFEGELAAARKQAADAERAASVACRERDISARKLEEAGRVTTLFQARFSGDAGNDSALQQRLSAAEHAAAEARGQRDEAQQDLYLARQTIERQPWA